jgi:hypothetical protein
VCFLSDTKNLRLDYINLKDALIVLARFHG